MSKRKQKRSPYLAGHQRSWIWGRYAVGEILDTAQWPMLELYLADDLSSDVIEASTAKAKQLGTEPLIVARARLRELCGAADHQGYLARMGPYPYITLEKALETDGKHPHVYLVLEGVRDPHNFGAIIRSAAALNVDAVIVGHDDQAPVNNHVARASAGAVNRIGIVQVNTIADVLPVMKARGIWCVATTPRATTAVWEFDFTQSVALLAGNESRGLAADLCELCDASVAVPGNSTIDSLNVHAATTAILYETMRQRQA